MTQLDFRPLMFDNEITIMKEIILKLVNGKSLPLEILEWGAGGSTVYFSSFLDFLKVDYKFLSLEYNKKWAETIREAVKDNNKIEIKLFDSGNDETKQRFTNMDNYVNYPASLNKKFDLIFIDGRKRRRCILESYNMISNGGVIILHDAERDYYKCALQGGEFLCERIWTKWNI